MFASLRNWCKQPIEVHRPGKPLPSGELSEEEIFTLKGLLVNDSKPIVDDNGAMTACKYYAYVIPTRPIEDDDLVKMPGAPCAMPIRKLAGYYDGNTGLLDIQVVYM